jgi:DNA-binding winged helix-turn-helix (wHTH) protein
MGSRDHAISFGPFRLLPAQQLLMEADKPIRIGSRALEILIALVERAGDIVSKEELIARVWPNTFVEENNLRVNIAALRRTLGDGQEGNRYVANIPVRGYAFIAPVFRSEVQTPSAPQPAAVALCALSAGAAHAGWSAAPISSTIAAQLPERRFITVVGPGGSRQDHRRPGRGRAANRALRRRRPLRRSGAAGGPAAGAERARFRARRVDPLREADPQPG